MSPKTPLHRLALHLVRLGRRGLPPPQRPWGEAMERELEHLEAGPDALRWAAGLFACLLTRAREEFRAFAAVARRPTAFLPAAMSLAALAVVLARIALVGPGPDRDEGAVAHTWQLLMAGQLPLLLAFILRWLPRAPRGTLYVLGLQLACALGAAAPVFLLGL